MKSLDQILKEQPTGLHYGNRIILPFKAHFLKIIIDNKMVTDFSNSASGIFIRESEDFTDIYFLDYKNLREIVTKFENIKMVIVEKGKNIFDFSNHRKIAAYLHEKHKLTFEETDDDILFIE
ncbi:MAG: hypothetical protein Kow0098_23480 [Ignavibacteriaceae bacterium]